MTTLVLVRHGPSAYAHAAGALDGSGVEQWRTHYDAAGVREDAQPPAALMRIAAEADCVVTSDLPRARESATRLFGKRPLITSPLLREFPLAVPKWPTRLPLAAWGAIIYLHWQIRRWRGRALTPADRAQVTDALRFVIAHTGVGATSVVVTHGVRRVLLAEQLVQDGWAARARHGGYGHWSAWIFQRATPPTPALQRRAKAV